MLGLLVGLAGFFLRRGIHAEEKRQEGGALAADRDVPTTIGRCCCAWPALSVFNAVGFYVMFVYIVSWLQLADGIAPAQALGINTISMPLLPP